MRSFIYLAIAAAACSGDAHGDLDAGQVPGGATTIHIVSDTTPLLLSVKDGAGAWQSPAPVEGGFEAEVHGPYSVLLACRNEDGNPAVYQVFQTPEDDPEVRFRCIRSTTPPYVVRGHLAQAGTVALGDRTADSDAPNWDFELRARAGTFDLVAVSADRIGVRRGISVTGDAVVAPIDLAREGAPLAGAAFSIANAAADEELEAEVGFLNPATAPYPVTIYRGDPKLARIAPAAALATGDRQLVTLRAIRSVPYGPTFTREQARPLPVGADREFAMPDTIQRLRWSATTGALGVTWEAAPILDWFVFWAQSRQGFHRAIASLHYVTAVRAGGLAIDTTVPGFQDSWKLDYTGPHDRFAFLQSEDELRGSRSVTVYETAGAAY